VARSVEAFREEYRDNGHQVLVVCPTFNHMPEDEKDVVRINAIQNFNDSDFSVALPLHPLLSEKIDAFAPDIVHSQHPFLLGVTALRIARHRNLPLVFTHHTLYEQYTHYLPGDSPAMKRFVIELATRYANLTDQVFTPSESIEELLIGRGMNRPIAVIPTGVRLASFAQGDGRSFRSQAGIPEDAWVIGHLGRLAAEKNLEFLAHSVEKFIRSHPDSHFLVIGSGPAEEVIRKKFSRSNCESRLHITGILQLPLLADALHAMDVFAFASRSETQGMVLTEAMAAGLPVVAIDASGTREVVRDQYNGRLLQAGNSQTFADSLEWLYGLPEQQQLALKQAALKTAEDFSMSRSAEKALVCYEALIQKSRATGNTKTGIEDIMDFMKTEWEILKIVARASDAAMGTELFSDREIKVT